VVSGPSGAGKTSVVDGLARRFPFHFSVSMTTRPPRPGEIDGEDYTFVGREQFDEAIAAGELVEWAVYSGHLYGTPRAEVDRHLAAGHDVLLDIEMIGSRLVHEAYPEAVMVYILPPSLEVLESRLRTRGDTDDVAERLAVARSQIEEAAGLFDHFVVNDDLDAAIEAVAGILRSLPPPLDTSS
jgi:guanylate kinase